MSSLDSIKDFLPSWYTAERYKHLSQASDKVLLCELWLRFRVKESINESDETSPYPAELFDERFLFEDELSKPDQYNALGNNIKVISTPVLKILSGMVYENDPENLKNELLHNVGHCNLFGNLFLAVNLRLASDDKLQEEFLSLVRKARIEQKIPQPRHPQRSSQKYSAIFRNHVFQYLDLTLWSAFKGIEIDAPMIARAIEITNPESEATPKEVNGKIKNTATQLLTMDVLRELDYAITRKDFESQPDLIFGS